MNEDEGELDKFLYGDEYSNVTVAATAATVEEEYEELEEEEEDDYEIILDSTKLPSTTTNDLNKRSLTSVSIDDGKGGEGGVAGGPATVSGTADSSAPTSTVNHFDPFAPGNLNGIQIFDHDLDNFEDKPWRKPGADLTDYFNFGFNEVTWRAYCVKQKALREEFGLQKKIGVYDSSSANVNANANINASSSSLNTNSSIGGMGNVRREYPKRSYHQQQQAYGYERDNRDNREVRDTRDGRDGRDTREGREGYHQHSLHTQHTQHSQHSHQQQHHQHHPRSRPNYDSPPPPPPPPTISRHVSSRDRSRSRSRSPENHRRYVSTTGNSSSSTTRSRYEEDPRSPPSKRRRD